MAPILSKPRASAQNFLGRAHVPHRKRRCRAQAREESFFSAAGAALTSKWQQLGVELCDLAAYVGSCVSEVVEQTLAPPLRALCENVAQLLRALHDWLCHARDRRPVPKSDFFQGQTDSSEPEKEEDKRFEKLSDYMPMCFIAQIVGMLYSSFVFAYMPAAGIAFSSPQSVAFHALVSMVLASYYQAVITDPGRIPDTAEWRTEGQPPACLQEEKVSGGARWCRKSEYYKPDRSHYCSGMQRCVLRMDHYCPWLSNTVGFANHKFFLLFLLYTSSTCVLTSASILKLLLTTKLPPSTFVFLMQADGVGLVLSSVLVPFTYFHCWLLGNNKTTIEYCESSGRKDGSIKDVDHNRYNVGLYRNVASVMGANPLTWLLPVGSPPGDGLSFPVYTVGSTGKKKVAIKRMMESQHPDSDGASTASSTRGRAGRASVSTVASENDLERASRKLEVEAQEGGSHMGCALEGVLTSCAMLHECAQDAACRLLRLCSRSDSDPPSSPAGRRRSVQLYRAAEEASSEEDQSSEAWEGSDASGPSGHELGRMFM